jgi:hypothetical protein
LAVVPLAAVLATARARHLAVVDPRMAPEGLRVIPPCLHPDEER